MFAEMDDFIGSHEGDAELEPFIEGLKSAKAQLQDEIGRAAGRERG